MIVAARAVHFASTMLLFGGILFILAVATPIWHDARAASVGSLQRLLRLPLSWGAYAIAASVVSGAMWLAAEVVSMSGAPLAKAIADGSLRLVLSGTAFGRLWVWRFGLVVALGVLLFAIGRATGKRSRFGLALGAGAIAGLYLATLAGSGHAAAALASGAYIQIVSDVVHLLAAGAWLGALPGLVYLLASDQPVAVIAEVTRRFSILGVVSVGAIVVSGVANSWYLVGSVPALLGTDYGRVLLLKIAVFAAMLALAAVNRFALTARLSPNSPLAQSAVRLLRRNAAMETAAGVVVVAIVGALGVMVPGAHQSPMWPFAYTLSWQAAQQSFAVGAAALAAAFVAVLAAFVALGGMLGRRWQRVAAAAATSALGAATSAWLLALPAYPTTYAASPVPYTTDAIAHGAALYAQNCVVCHGPNGRGDGPLATSLPIVPTDVAAHASGHRVGELFWWIAHGIPNSPMPAFAPRLGATEIWDLVQFLRAQSEAVEATTLTTRAQPWRSAIPAPDFSFELEGKGQSSLSTPQGGGSTLLVLYTAPQSSPYLRVLADETATFGEIGLRVVAIPMSVDAPSVGKETSDAGGPIVAIARPDVMAAYAMLARQDGAPPNAVPEQADFLIDRQGYVRARWIGVPSSPTARFAEIFDQAELLRGERQRAPATMGHMH